MLSTKKKKQEYILDIQKLTFFQKIKSGGMIYNEVYGSEANACTSVVANNH